MGKCGSQYILRYILQYILQYIISNYPHDLRPQLNNYAFFYGTPLDTRGRETKYTDAVATILTYQQVRGGLVSMSTSYCI